MCGCTWNFYIAILILGVSNLVWAVLSRLLCVTGRVHIGTQLVPPSRGEIDPHSNRGKERVVGFSSSLV